MALLISAAGAGSQGSLGSPQARNVAQGIFALVVDALRVGNSLVTRDAQARALAFDLTDALAGTPSTALRFTFGGAQIQSAVTAGNQVAFGLAAIVNAAQGAFAQGIGPGISGLHVVLRGGASSPLALNLTGALIGDGTNVTFTFGGAQLISGATAGAQSAVGGAKEVKQPISARPVGIFAGAVGLPRLADAARNGTNVLFDLSLTHAHDGAALRFDFGAGARPISWAGAGNQCAFGATTVENVALGAFQQGFDAAVVGTPAVFSPFVRDGWVNFELSQDVRGWPALNVPFYFNDPAGFSPAGIDSLIFGATVIETEAQGAFPVGIPPGGFGTATLQTPQFIQPIGFNASVMGGVYQASWRKFVTPAGAVRTLFGATTKIELFNRSLPVPGTVMTRYGTAVLTHGRRYIIPTGIPAGAVGSGQRIWFRVRHISPNGIAATGYGQTHEVTHIDLTQTVSPASLQAMVWGFATLNLMRRYLAPTGIPTGLTFGNQTEVFNLDRVIGAFGFDFQRFGTPALEETNYTRTLKPAPILGAIGSHAVANRNRYIHPESWTSDAFSGFGTSVAIDDFGKLGVRRIDPPLSQVPAPLVWLYSQFLVPAGWVAWKVGSPSLTHKYRPIAPQGFVASAYGTPMVDRDLRYITVQGFSAQGVGSHVIQLRRRVLFTFGSITVRFGAATMGYDVGVVAGGLDATRWGDTHVADNTQRILPAGIIGLWGDARVRLAQRHIVTPSLPPQQIVSTKARVELSRRYVEQFTDLFHTWGPFFGLPTQVWVRNRNQQVATFGQTASKVPIGAVVYNAARIVAPVGWRATAFGPDGFIADAVRYLRPDGMESFPILRWTIVRNGARVIATQGLVQTLSGFPDVLNRNRTIKHYPNHYLPDSVFGTAFIAYRIRSIVSYGGLTPPPMGFARVFNAVQYLRPTGFAWKDGTGGHHVHEHFNIIGPVRTVVQTLWGDAWVRNKTPQLYAYGHDSTLSGATRIRLQYRFVTVPGYRTDLIGRPAIGDRRTWLRVMAGINASRFGLQLVKLANPDLPWPQLIDLDGLGYGAKPSGKGTGWWGGGAEKVSANSLYPESIEPPSAGEPTVYLQGIRPDSIIPAENFSLQFGIPGVNPWFRISPNGMEPVMPSRTDPGTVFSGSGPTKHRVSPNTIWARTDAPQQARANHGGNTSVFHPVDTYLGALYEPHWPMWGRPRVENKNRRVTARGVDPMTRSDWGTAKVRLWTVFVSPTGFKAFKYGVAELFGGSRNFQFYGFDMAETGTPAVGRYVAPNVTRTIPLSGLLAYATGANVIMLKNRQVHPSGFLGTRTGNEAWVSRSPRTVQQTAAQDHLRFGTQWASLWTRTIFPMGSDTSWTEGYSYDHFDWRMRVKTPHRPIVSLGHQGAVGLPRIESGTRMIRQTDEIAPQAPPLPRVAARSIIALGGYGLAAAAFGDIDRWEAGKVKAHGSDLFQPGTPRTTRTVEPSGISGEFGGSRLGRRIYGSGLDALALGHPATPMLNPHICGSTARAMVPHAFVAPSAGNPVVGHA